MTGWDRIQRLELDLALARAALTRALEERDTARRIAVRLEAECHALTPQM